MGSDLPPRVTYWTGIWSPNREALTNEVQMLRGALAPRAPVVSFSSGQRSGLSLRDYVIRLSGTRWVLLRAAAAALERTGQVTHVFGEIDAWHLLRGVGRRPVLFTVTIPGRPLGLPHYKNVALFAAETKGLAQALEAAGVSSSRISIIPPGVDLDRFQPASPPSGRFRVLFASSPASSAELETRGIPLLMEAARLCPDVDFLLVWRRWGDRAKTDNALAALRPPSNVIVEHRDFSDMAAVYQGVHATILMSRDGFGKACPNSIVEGLACGRPAVVSDGCHIADVIASGEAGMAVPRHPRAVAEAIERLKRDGESRRRAARALAEARFSKVTFLAAYKAAYERLAGAETTRSRVSSRCALRDPSRL
jgi:glycosyltransferase involved in cell wall biosynthesis